MSGNKLEPIVVPSLKSNSPVAGAVEDKSTLTESDEEFLDSLVSAEDLDWSVFSVWEVESVCLFSFVSLVSSISSFNKIEEESEIWCSCIFSLSDFMPLFFCIPTCCAFLMKSSCDTPSVILIIFGLISIFSSITFPLKNIYWVYVSLFFYHIV